MRVAVPMLGKRDPLNVDRLIARLTRNSFDAALLGLIAAAALPVVAYAAMVIVLFSDALERNAEGRLTGVAAMVGRALDQKLLNELRLLETLATSPKLARRDFAGFHEQASRALERLTEWTSIALFDAGDRSMVLNTLRPYGAPMPTAIADAASFALVISEGRPVIGSLSERDWRDGPPFIPLRVPVFVNGRVAFVLSAGLKPALVETLLADGSLPSSWSAAVLDPSLRPVARVNTPADSRRAVPPPLATAIAASATGMIRSEDAAGAPVYAIHRQSALTGWVVTLGVPRSEVEAGFRQTVSLTWAGGAVLALASLALAFSIASTIRRRTRTQEHARAAELERYSNAQKEARWEAERANIAKSRFLAAASHDLRQPFQAMRLFYHAMEPHVASSRAAPMHTGLGKAMAAGEGLLKALLDVSTLDAGSVRPAVQAVLLDSVVQPLIAEFAPLAERRGLTLRCRLLPGAVRTDPLLLGRILRNLLSNALRYTERGGVLVACRRRGEGAVIQVWDTGTGIAAEHLSVVFDDFVQLGNPERDRTKGLGLGLPIARRTARLLGSDVTVRSRHGRGSVFSVALPWADTVEIPAAERSAATTAGAQRILLIEDDTMQLGALSLMLEQWGHHVTGTSNPADAADLAAAGADPPTLIISDFRLPGPINGVELVDAVRARLGTAVPAIMVTGDTDPSCIRQITTSGIELLYKPYNPEQLFHLIAAAAVRADAA